MPQNCPGHLQASDRWGPWGRTRGAGNIVGRSPGSRGSSEWILQGLPREPQGIAGNLRGFQGTPSQGFPPRGGPGVAQGTPGHSRVPQGIPGDPIRGVVTQGLPRGKSGPQEWLHKSVKPVSGKAICNSGAPAHIEKVG